MLVYCLIKHQEALQSARWSRSEILRSTRMQHQGCSWGHPGDVQQRCKYRHVLLMFCFISGQLVSLLVILCPALMWFTCMCRAAQGSAGPALASKSISVSHVSGGSFMQELQYCSKQGLVVCVMLKLIGCQVMHGMHQSCSEILDCPAAILE
jgi:hypothetical protein